jgi:hypothetical protein
MFLIIDVVMPRLVVVKNDLLVPQKVFPGYFKRFINHYDKQGDENDHAHQVIPLNTIYVFQYMTYKSHYSEFNMIYSFVNRRNVFPQFMQIGYYGNQFFVRLNLNA